MSGPSSGMISPAMGKWIILLITGLSLTAVALIPGHLEAQTAPDRRFGLTEVFWLPDEAEDLGVGWERILFYWRELQPEGPDDWNTLHVREEWLVEAESQGREVVGLIKNTAPWASEDGTEAGLPKGLYLPLDDPNNLWANFVGRLADYYSERGVHHWIIWNEPEIEEDVYGFEFAGSVNDYYQLLKTAYMVIKQRYPQAIVHLAGLTYWHDPTFLDRLLAIAAADPDAEAHDYFFDVISLHIYFRTETVKTIIDEVNEIQARYEMSKPIWINETNAPPNRDPGWPVDRPRFNIDLEQQASFIIQAFALGFASGAERISVYKLLDIHLAPGGESFGLVRPDNSRRPAYDAYKAATRCLGGYDAVTKIENPLFYHVTFKRPGTLTPVAWSRTPAESAIRIPATADGATIVRLDGSSSDLSSENGHYSLLLPGQRCDQECLVGGEPLLIVEETGTASILSTCVNFTEEEFSSVAADEGPLDRGDLIGGEHPVEETESGIAETADDLDYLTEAPTVSSDVLASDSMDGTGAQPEESFQASENNEATPTNEKNTDLVTSSQAATEPEEIRRDSNSAGDESRTIGLWFLAVGLGLAGIVAFYRRRTINGRSQ